MFEQFYGLKENPFNITADPSFFYASKHHQEAMAHLEYGINSRKGIMMLTGEVGTGKTTLCRIFLNKVTPNIKTAFILNPSFSQIQLLQMITRDLGLNLKKTNKMDLINGLNDFLLQTTSEGNNVAVIIDEAQNLNTHQLEQIRLLSNLETEKDKLLQIILVGQPELLDKLKNPSLRQLAQRVTVRHHMSPLEQNELSHYIHHRLTIAGATKKLLFDDAAVKAIFAYSKGTPRIVNVLSERALLAGFTQETFTITKTIIDQCAEETGYSLCEGVVA